MTWERARRRAHATPGPMTPRRGAALIWGGCLLVALATLVSLALGAGERTPADSFGLSGYGGLAFVVASLAFATVGSIVAARVPANPIGWIFCLTGAILGVGDLLFQYADLALFISPQRLSGGATAAWLQNVALPPSFGLLGIALLVFPDGRLPSRRWRPVLWLALLGIALIVLGYALRPGPLDDPFASVSNPVGIAGSFGLMDAFAGLGWMFMGASVGLAALGTGMRLRRSRGVERAQLKWLAFAAAAAGVAIVADVISYFADVHGISGLRNVLLGLGFAVFPVAAGAAILRYRLFDIDVVINRALVYGALSATLAGAYLGSVLLLQLVMAPLTADSGLAIAASTLAVAALFRPARGRIQGVVDRRFYRRRYDAVRTLEAFSARLRGELDLDAVGNALCTAVRDTVQPAHLSLWLSLEARNDSRTDGP